MNRPAPPGSVARTARAIGLAAFLLYVLSGGGRVVGSDEVSMLELSRALLRGRIEVPEGATVTGRGGYPVTKGSAGQAVLALPLVALSEAAASGGGPDPARRVLAVRFGSSFLNAAVVAILLGVFYAGARRLGAGAGAALAASAMLGFATPLWVYAKSFMAEPTQALGLVCALVGASLAAESGRERAWGAGLAALGAFLAVSVKLSMLPVAVACMAPLVAAPLAAWRLPLLGFVLALAGHGLYNVARFGTPLETGYGLQATPAAYTTPILVGLYGLLLSSGKGVLWFAPPIALAPWGWAAKVRGSRAAGAGALARAGLATSAGRAAVGALIAWGAGLFLYARFQHWGGDGSFGPRYLVPLLPLAFIPVAFALSRDPARGGRVPPARATVAALLAAIGLVVQLGGVAIYFGAQMREAGDYPYTLPIEHPRFMSDSHFNPAMSPIAGHWRMLVRNAREHLSGHAPRLGGEGPKDPRLGLSPAEQQALLHALDFWWLYLGYAGFPRAPILAALVVLSLLAAWALRRVALAFRAEARAP